MRSAFFMAAMAMLLGGCSGPEYVSDPYYPTASAVPAQAAPLHPNPVFIPIADHRCAWEQTVDMVDNYFRIEHEEPVRALDNMVTDGVITTLPEVSPTIFEPWRRDTADPEQRLENTLQTMRRRGVIRVIPGQGGHWVDVQIYKELEDNRRPEHSNAGSATFRYDDTLKGIIDPVYDQPITKGWIAKGRDVSLEQTMIGDLLSRTGQYATPTVMPGPVAVPGPSAAPQLPAMQNPECR